MREYDKDLYILRHNVEHLERCCKRYNSSECHTVLNAMERKMNEINILDSVIETNMKRQHKRSAFWYSLLGSAVGYMGEKIVEKEFGTSEIHTNEMIKKTNVSA